MTHVSPPVWNRHAWWAALGCLLLGAVVTLSLVYVPRPLDFPGADKYEHLLAYGTLMYWWGMLQPHRRLRWALALPLLGVTLELAQHLAPGRYMEWRDALANTIGVGLGLAVLATPLGRLLGWLDRQLPNRGDTDLA